MQQTKFLLDEKRIPESWYNLVPDLPFQLEPPLNPATMEPVGPEAFAPIFPEEIIRQEVTTESYVPIPEEVREIYALWRPTPLFRARRLEKLLDTPAHIYYKYEGVSPSGSHKPNTAIPQAFYNKQEGVRRLTTETGAGQWGSSLAFACETLGLDCTVYMVRVSYGQKPYRRIMMETYGAEVYPSPTDLTQAGRDILAEDPDSPGSLGIAISEAVEDAVKHEDAKYSLGSVLNHVLLHQTVIGQEALEQMELAGEYPDVVVGCVGGGSNFGGIAFPFIRENLKGNKDTRIIGVEPASCPTLTKGRYVYDFGDTAGTTPMMKMYTLGHSFVPSGIHAGGLRYHGDSHRLGARPRGPRRGAGLRPEPDLRGRRHVRQGRGHRARPRSDARHKGDHRPRPRSERGRRREDHPLQPLRPRPLRLLGLRAVPGGQPRQPGALG